MLRGTVAFLVLVTFAVLGTELREAISRRGLRAPAMEGILFLAVGFALGGRGLGLFPADVLANLRVVVLFGLGWIGLVFGIQIDLRVLRRLSVRHRSLGILTPLFLGVPVALGGMAIGLTSALSFGLAAVAMASSPSFLEALARERRIRDRDAVGVLKLVMAFAGIPAVLLFTLAAAVASPLGDPRVGALPAWHLMFLTMAVGVVVGYSLVVLVRGVHQHIHLLTLAVGTVCLIAGATSVLGLSALPAAAFAGAVLVNRAVFPHRMLRVAHSLERPMLVALLVLVGASWEGARFALPVFLLLTVVRMTGAVAAGVFMGWAMHYPRVTRRRPGLGWGLLPQGELALGLLVAIVSSFAPLPGVLEAVVAALVVNNLVGGWWMRRRLASGGSGETAA